MGSPDAARGQPAGHLVIVGGGLRSDNAPVFARLIGYAGGHQRARFVILPTAGRTLESAQNFRECLAAHGLPQERIEVLNVTVENARQSASDPAIVEQVRGASGLFITGGDQQRIMRALVQDGLRRPCSARFVAYSRAGE
jgi:cyanophycinase